MSRRSKPQKRIPMPDPVYNSKDIAKFIRYDGSSPPLCSYD